MTNTPFPNQVRAYDRVDEFDDVLHYIHQYPKTVPASQIRVEPGQVADDYIWEDHMDINPTTGEVMVDRLPNMEFRPANGVTHEFPFSVAATDGLNITVQDVMFEVKHVIEPPKWPVDVAHFYYTEGTPFLEQFVAYDPEQGDISYHLDASLLPGFTITSAGGFLSGVTPANPTPDVASKQFLVHAKSSASGIHSTLECVLHITNNNRAPVWNTSPIFNVSPGMWTTSLSATDRENDGPVTYEIVGENNGFVLSPIGTLARDNSDETANHVVVVRAYSGTGDRRLSTDLTITVKVTELPNDPPAWITPVGPIGSGEGGSVFNFQLQATDTELVTYEVTSGALPAGLSMDIRGRITGFLPAVSQGTTQYSFTVTASDGENFVPRTFSISVTRTNNPPSWNTPAGLLLDVWAGQPIDLQLSATDPEGAALSYTITKPSSLGWMSMTQNGRLTGRVPLDAEVTTANIVFTVSVTDGAHIVSREFQVRIKRLAPQTIGFTSSSEWLVPEGCYQMMLTWVVGAGGGGGAGHELGNGGGGAGGGSGGFERYVPLDVSPGDRIVMDIGAGGIGFSGSRGVMGYGGNGGGTRVLKNGTVVVQAGGGSGGGTSPNFNGGRLPSVPGQGGVPNGIAGVAGQIGWNDKASCYGGEGAHGPLIGAAAGAGGQANGGNNYTTGPGAGKPGVGPGSSGGGGGSQDRVNKSQNYWKGGNGSNGYVEFTFPSQGPVGGTAPWEPSQSGGGTGGGTGGGIGGSCAWVEAVLPNGKIVGDAVVGDELLLLNEMGDGYFKHPVTGVRFDTQQCFTITTETGIELTVSNSTPIVIKTISGYTVVNISASILMERVPVLDNGEFRWDLVVDLKEVGALPVALISADNGIYASGNKEGRYIFTHNISKEITDESIMV